MTSETVSVPFPPTRSRPCSTTVGPTDRVARRHVGVPLAWVAAGGAASVSAGLLWSVSGPVAVLAGLAGAVAVGPVVAHVVLWWVGWRVVLPLVLGGIPASAAVRGARARCPRCGGDLSPWGLPAIPWTARGGRCGACGSALPGWIGGIELSAGAVFAVSAGRFGWAGSLWPVLAFAAGAVAVCAVDIQVGRIPTRIVALTGSICLGLITVVSLVAGTPGAVAGSAVGAVTAGGLMLGLHALSPSGLGMGDVRMAGLVGLVTSWVSWAPGDALTGSASAALLALFVATVVASASHGVVALRHRSVGPLPFAPALTAGALVVVWSAP